MGYVVQASLILRIIEIAKGKREEKRRGEK